MYTLGDLVLMFSLRLANELAFVKNNFPTMAGFSVWSAGAFDTTYVLTQTPFANGTDQPLFNAAGESLPVL